ncbi:NUDIX hydrolase [Sphaerisporangium album]|uniref:NUDIX hydrolase n=1 Tax=Sphaerisporangium album TaxID=509200 RepID=A0A367FNH8_9ACTN|nr:NUDIX hydrolase [Sphaerisporangium album]RCG31956.1 NUDIX hydrolase [Sphaerisporangium album]
MGTPDPSYIADLVRVRAAAGALIRDEVGRVLLVRPTYKPRWDIPGGMLEAGESPRAACVREVKEELGIVAQLGDMLCVDWVPPRPPWDGGLMFVFDGGVLTAGEAGGIRLQPSELDRFVFAGPEEAEVLLPPELARRVRASLRCLAGGACYLEDGYPAG